MEILPQIRFHTTYSCNLRCKYCYLQGRLEKPKKDYSYVINAAKDIFNFLKGSARTHQILLHGAETMLIPAELLCEVYNILSPLFVKQRKMSIQTNGTLFTDENILLLKDKFIFSISLDGPEEWTDKYRGRGTYAKVVKGLSLLKKYNVPRYVLSTISHELIADLPKFEKFLNWCESEDIHWCGQFLSDAKGFSKEEQEKFADFLYEKDLYKFINIMYNDCFGKGNHCDILKFKADGYLTPCDRTELNTRISWKTESFKKVFRLRVEAFDNIPSADECNYCEVKPLCNSGCPVNRAKGRAIECFYLQRIIQLESEKLGLTRSELIKEILKHSANGPEYLIHVRKQN